jgi:hypothetical protein
MQSKIKKIDFVLIGISLIAVIGLMFYYWNIFLPNGEFGIKGFDLLYYDYNKNIGIILIQSINSISWIGILSIGILWIKRRSIDYKWIYLIFSFCIILAITRWIEIWYGSTFYYGEVRDKQGLYFPIFGLLLTFYTVWRFKIELINKKQIIIKSIVSIVITLIFLSIYFSKYDTWNIGQS